MNPMTTSEFVEALDSEIQGAIDEIVKRTEMDLNDYLTLLDATGLVTETANGVTVKFLPEHRVIAEIPVPVIPGYQWAFTTPYITVEVDGVFEARLT